jgi:oxygen-independent coproporphyrinogen-3 oxidase
VQAFEADALRWLGRMHSPEQADEAVRLGLSLGRVSVDVIAGLPGDAPGRVDEDLARVAGLGAGHVSVYLLTVEPDTPLDRMIARGRREDVDDDAQADTYARVQAELGRLGYRQYEVSSYARAGDESQHNRVYWSQGTYLGLGPGAHSMRLMRDGSVVRRANAPDLARYIDDARAAGFESETLSAPDALREAVAFGLRDLVSGVALDAIATRHRTPLPPDIEASLRRRERDGHTALADGRWHLTTLGARFADGVGRDILEP